MASNPLTLATLNMLKGGGRRVNAAQVLRRTRADLLFLQEAAALDGLAASLVWQALDRQGWGSAVVATQGRLEPLAVRGFEGWVAAARWDVPGRDSVTVVSVHVPHGPGGYAARMLQILDAVAGVAPAPGSSEVVIGGDFNICISARLHTGGAARAREREVQSRLREQFGLINCWDTLHPRMQPAQTLRWTGDREVPYHCDGLFVPGSWSGSLRRCVVRNSPWWCARSDHNPVIASFH